MPKASLRDILFLPSALTTTTPDRALRRGEEFHHLRPHWKLFRFLPSTNPLSFIFPWAAMSHNVSPHHAAASTTLFYQMCEQLSAHNFVIN
jgi:hypothetical protein